MSILSISLLVISISTIAWTLRTGAVSEKYSFMWVLSAVIILVLSVFPKTLDWAADRLDVAIPSNLLFLIGLVALLIVVVTLSLDLSRQGKQIRRLAEEIAILENRVLELQSE
jgi:hypothetical protein